MTFRRLPQNTTGIEDFQEMSTDVTHMSSLLRVYYTLMGLLIILLLMWLLGLAAAQPRLAVVANTIQVWETSAE